MPRTRACDYCGDDIEPGTGTMLVRTNGSTIHYCSAKCEKNADLGREARDLEWTAAGQAEGGEAVEADDEVEPETVEEVDERETAGASPDLEEAEQDAAAASADAEDESEADEAETDESASEEAAADEEDEPETDEPEPEADDGDEDSPDVEESADEKAVDEESADEDAEEDADEETEEAQA